MNKINKGVNSVKIPLKDKYFFSFFSKPITSKIPLKTIDLKELHSIIISDKYKVITENARQLNKVEYDLFKAKYFDYVTFNGTFGKRADNGLINPSGLFVIDVDHIGENLQAMLERLKTDTIITPVLIFISPSGDGLKIVVSIDTVLIQTDGSKRMGLIWDAVNSYFSMYYADLLTPTINGDFIDGACKDLSRACFICHDADAYLRESEPNILDKRFIHAYIDLPIDDSPRPIKKQANNKKVSPKTSISDLAQRHLLPTDNHTPHLLSFTGACKNVGISKETVKSYIANNIHIAPDSSKAISIEIDKLINDVFDRYKSSDNEGVFITQLEFAYSILKFKFNKDATAYLPTTLHLDGIRNILHNAGFAKRCVGNNLYNYIRKVGCIIEETTPQIMQDYVLNLITELNFIYQNKAYCIPVNTVRETFLKTMHLVFNGTWADCLNESKEPILKDTESEMFFCFKNKFVTVTKENIKGEEWNEKSGFVVWQSQIIQHDFSYIQSYDSGVWYQFLRNVCNSDAGRLKTMFSAIGYLMHHYFKENEGQAVILYDEAITDLKKPQGGSGKGLIVNGIKQLRNTSKVDGKHFESTNRFKFEQVEPSTQLIWIDDTKPDFDFTLLFSNLTDGWTIERKYKSQFLIKASDSPKTIICSNSTLKGEGRSNTRRRFEIELSDFYSKQITSADIKPIEQTHGCIFFSKQWNLSEWDMFFSVMMDAAHCYLNTGLVPHKGINIALNRFKQNVGIDFAEWIETSGIVANQWYTTKDYYSSFIQVYYGESPQKISPKRFTEHLKAYAEYKQLKFDRKESNGSTHFILISG